MLTTAGVGQARLAHAEDRIAELTRTLSSSSEKARLAAAAALGKLGDRRAMKPLVAALRDPSPQIRAVAAAALGKLGHKAALPSLKGAAEDDVDGQVRVNARHAAVAVAKANGLPSPWPAPAAARPARPGFGKQPRALDPAPDVYVLVNSSADDSPGKADKPTRKAHAEIVRKTLVESCNSNPVVTTAAAEAQRLGLDPRHIDLAVVKMDVATVGSIIEVDAQLRLAISDGQGKMLSFLSGGAKVQVPKHKFDARYLPQMRREALENAVRGMFDKLVAHLRDQRANS
ncbi:MAG TPA: HEAT repeat domain-containing protein [Kofleriaceae bacterium]|nr:HEAT repeat domain-containing protein [Kofleriaceae bacterium]